MRRLSWPRPSTSQQLPRTLTVGRYVQRRLGSLKRNRRPVGRFVRRRLRSWKHGRRSAGPCVLTSPLWQSPSRLLNNASLGLPRRPEPGVCSSAQPRTALVQHPPAPPQKRRGLRIGRSPRHTKDRVHTSRMPRRRVSLWDMTDGNRRDEPLSSEEMIEQFHAGYDAQESQRAVPEPRQVPPAEPVATAISDTAAAATGRTAASTLCRLSPKSCRVPCHRPGRAGIGRRDCPRRRQLTRGDADPPLRPFHRLRGRLSRCRHGLHHRVPDRSPDSLPRPSRAKQQRRHHVPDPSHQRLAPRFVDRRHHQVTEGPAETTRQHTVGQHLVANDPDLLAT